MSKEDMIREAVEEAKAKAAQVEQAVPSDELEEAMEEDIKRILEDMMEFEEVEAQEDNDEISSLKKGDGVEDVDIEDEVMDSAETEEVAEEEAVETEESENKEKKLFGRKKKDKKDEKIEELTDRLARSMAEFDNFRKRTEKEKSRMYEVGAKDIIEKILPTIDNFERGLSAVAEEDKSHPFMEGMEKIYKHLMTTLEDIHVKPIEAVGTQFNPDLHNAVMHVEDEEYGENMVVEEFQKGYTYRDNVIRYSMVKVAN